MKAPQRVSQGHYLNCLGRVILILDRDPGLYENRRQADRQHGCTALSDTTMRPAPSHCCTVTALPRWTYPELGADLSLSNSSKRQEKKLRHMGFKDKSPTGTWKLQD